MIHRWQSYAAVLPEGQQAIEDIGTFIREQFPNRVCEEWASTVPSRGLMSADVPV